MDGAGNPFEDQKFTASKWWTKAGLLLACSGGLLAQAGFKGKVSLNNLWLLNQFKGIYKIQCFPYQESTDTA